MKLTTFFVLISMISVFANKTYSQSKMLNLNMEKATVRDVLSKIENQSEFHFMYSAEVIDVNRLVSINVQDAKIDEVLKSLFAGTKVDYTIQDRFVVLSLSEFSNASTVQQKSLNVSGKVTDSTGSPLPGVTVVVKGTTRGIITDANGNYILDNIPSDGTLVFSFVGMKTQEIAIAGKSVIDIEMAEDAIGIEEVVAVGYGTQKKVNLTGSVGMATAQQLENRPIISAGEGLQGVIPNLNITIRNGDPTRTADFNVRGYESINGGSPLILIDGVPGNMDKLNPNDIQSVTVLKDAAAAAVYGARAAFGVILVETKRGEKGKMKVTLSTEQSATKPIFRVDPITDPYDAAVIWNLAYDRTKGTPRYDDDYMAGFLAYKENPTEANEWGVVNGNLRHYGYTDYTGMTVADFSKQKKYDMNISGAREDASYYVSFGYTDKDGWRNVADEFNDKYQRYNVLMKADFKINNWLSVDEQITWSSERNDSPHFYYQDVDINTVTRVVPQQIITFPDLPYYLEPGDHDNYLPYIGKYMRYMNPFPYWEEGGRDEETKQRLLMKQGITLTPVKGLRVKGDFAYTTYHRERQEVASKVSMVEGTDLTNMYFDYGFSGDDWIKNFMSYNQYYTMNIYAEYTYNELKDHYIKAMVGYNQEWGRNTFFSARASTLITPSITDLNATTGMQQTEGSKSHVSLRGVFYRLNYNYKEKYLVEMNGRYDGTSRFPPDDRFGFFPSFSVAWRMSNEGFMSGASAWLDNLKLRASYGTLGNQLLGSGNANYYPYVTTMGSGMSPYMMTASGFTPYVSAAGLVSPTLTWETVVTQNLGIDVTMLNQRLDVSFDAFYRDTKGMLMDVEYPALLGTNAPKSNAADLRTKGWELSIGWHDRIGKDWAYNVTLGIGDNQAEITKYDNPTGALSEYYVGKKIGEIWGYTTEGIFQYDEDVATHADQSKLGSNWRAGDMMYKDLNDDGEISSGTNTLDDPGDRSIIGNTTARYSFGINPDIQYKNWTLSFFFQGLKRDYLPSNSNWNAFYPFNADLVEKYYLTDTWSEDNRDAYFAAPHVSTDTKKNIMPQSRYVQNATYIRLKNLTLNYNLPKTLVNKIGLSRAQLYVSGMNLWEASGMRAPLDPEQVSTTEQEYYFNRVYTLGVKVTF